MIYSPRRRISGGSRSRMRSAASTRQVNQDRRQFVVSASLAAGGLALGIVSIKAKASALASGPWSPDAIEGGELSAWVEIAGDDTVTMRVPTPEIGNGAMTQVAMNVTEELACDWSRVRVGVLLHPARLPGKGSVQLRGSCLSSADTAPTR